ncbi:ankyrin repeat domain-containing protein [Flavobacterium soli]|uniref:ankyrin repeat domain-containing protein n=1 Tax=Flavobacterium soli TaxID=344881 RepID=UPI00041EB2E1|nr:ankyrin repeat domain-containing protein [Flavobacterium soli]
MRDLVYAVVFIFISKTAFSQNSIFSIARKRTAERVLQNFENESESVDRVNEEGLTPLIIACCSGNSKAAKLLLEKKANPNICDANGNSALLYAVQFKNLELVELLLQYDADKSQKDDLGKTAFEYAAFLNDKKMLGLLQ